MTRYADPERCPDCREEMPYGATSCPSCGLSLEGPLAAQLFATLSAADDLLDRMRRPAGPVPATATATSALTAATAAPAARSATPGAPVGPGVGLLEHPEGGTADASEPFGDVLPKLTTTSVPRILLGLGALCLLVAALVFIAVAWSAMGVGGRTATLLGFTAVAGALTGWAARQDLRAAAEALGVVALGLLAFDLVGARDAGWLGPVSTPGFLVVLGSVLVVAGAAAALAVRRTPAGALVGAEVVAGLGLVAAVAGATSADWLSVSAGQVLAFVTSAAVVGAARTLRLSTLTAGAAVVSATTWLVLALSALGRALEHPSHPELWLDLEAWPLAVAAALAVAPALSPRLPHPVRRLALGTALLLASALLLAPVADESVTAATLAGACLLTGAAGTTWAVAAPWRAGFGGVLVLGGLWLTVAAWTLVLAATNRLAVAAGAGWAGGAGDLLPGPEGDRVTLAAWLLPVVVLAVAAALVALARTFGWADRVLAPVADLHTVSAVAAATGVLTAASYAVPVWAVLAALLGAAAGFVARSLRHDAALPLALGAAFLVPAVAVSLHAEWLTLPAVLTALVLSAAVHLRRPEMEVAAVAGLVGAGSLAGLGWTVGAVTGSSPEWTGAVTLGALALLVLGMPYVDRGARGEGSASVARLGTEAGALLAAGALAAAAVPGASPGSQATWLAVYLTVSGAAASALALLRPDRRAAGWLGGLLLAAATWVRLADLGVEQPEAYTLPSALALLAVGLVHLRRRGGASTLRALSPGLALALLPSLLWVLVEPGTPRSLLLGAACLALVVTGARVRWSAPVLHGAAVGALLVLRHAAPVVDAVPRWALIGTAGVLLVTMGVTWERRLREARSVAGYLRRLR